ncbi:hypothetical protein MGA5115_01999 [Marinomonas gallaica]|uniref:DUF6795 domain-containing protein n=1 Tax=Marinomonas gallaica TaxID=1806667 RepID=A0A1C3JRQ0_9GAMM|nr:DUF6795 domain-containing protein [Marinomonas gallaica]SBT17883.1 hypothetical protein MGA5115_01999 [Marinomonas gallaica]SBT22031.1 hypothetical protein MGA5116_02642 [Marinomonas gallaica]
MSSFARPIVKAMFSHPKLTMGSALILLVLWLSSTVYGDEGMGLFKKKEAGCVFSGFEGQLLYQGEPAADAVLIRKYELFGRKGEDKTIADAAGNFEFNSVFWEFTEPFITPTGFLVHQQIFVQYQNTETQIWGGAKVEPPELYEFNNQQPNNLVCEITDGARRVNTGERGFIGTNCHWN